MNECVDKDYPIPNKYIYYKSYIHVQLTSYIASSVPALILLLYYYSHQITVQVSVPSITHPRLTLSLNSISGLFIIVKFTTQWHIAICKVASCYDNVWNVGVTSIKEWQHRIIWVFTLQGAGIYFLECIHLCLLFMSQLQIYTTITQVFFILANQCSGHWSLNFALQAIRHNSKFFIAHTMLLVVLAGHSPFLKASKSSSPILKLNRSAGTWPAVHFWGFLIPVAAAAGGFSEQSSEGTSFLCLFKDG